MIRATDFLGACRRSGIAYFTGTPCSYMAPLFDALTATDAVTFRVAPNEGDAVAMAAGAYVATGRPGVVLFQNSGLGNAVNALTSLSFPFRLPMLLVVGHRGQPGVPDEPQHALMGEVTTELLDLLRIPWERFPPDPDGVDSALARAMGHFAERSLPYGLVVTRGAIAGDPVRPARDEAAIGWRELAFTETLPRRYEQRHTRAEALTTLQRAVHDDDMVVATTGYTGRELYALSDAENQFYMVGSMGCASAFGLELALHHPDRRVWIADGDGAVLMRLGNLASVGAFHPRNLFHLVLDNEAHESTGGQPTVSRRVAFGAVAQACGYARVVGTDSLEELTRLVAAHSPSNGPTLVHFRLRTGALPNLGRPRVTPAEVKERFMRHLHIGP